MEVALIPIWQVNGHFNRQFNAFGNCLLGQYYLFSSARRKPIILLLNSAVMKASTSRNARMFLYTDDWSALPCLGSVPFILASACRLWRTLSQVSSDPTRHRRANQGSSNIPLAYLVSALYKYGWNTLIHLQQDQLCFVAGLQKCLVNPTLPDPLVIGDIGTMSLTNPTLP